MTKTRSSQAASSKEKPKAVSTTAKASSKSVVVSPDSKVSSNVISNTNVIDGVPVFDFSTLLGARPKDTKGGGMSRNCKLKVATIHAVGLVFRVEPEASANPSAWPEKLFSDAVRDSADWAVALNIQKYVPTWYVDNVQVKNAKGYNVRTFVIKFEEGATELKEEGIFVLAEYICKCLNKMSKNNPVTTVDKNDLFWLRDGVWSDVMGKEQAMVDLSFDLKRMFFEPMDNKVNKVLTYFEKESLTRDMLSELFPDINIEDNNALKCLLDRIEKKEENNDTNVEKEEDYELCLSQDESDEEEEFEG